jgi:aryl carrier-like protein
MPPMTTPADRIAEVFHHHVPPGRRLAHDTNFFEAGFTSARLNQVLAGLAHAGIDVTLLDFFQYPTLGELTDEVLRRTPAARQRDDQHQLPWQRR